MSYGDTAVAAKVFALAPHESGVIIVLEVAGVKIPYLLDRESGRFLASIADRQFKLFQSEALSGNPISEPFAPISLSNLPS